MDAWTVAIAVTVASLLASMTYAGAGCMGAARVLAAVAVLAVVVALPLSRRKS